MVRPSWKRSGGVSVCFAWPRHKHLTNLQEKGFISGIWTGVGPLECFPRGRGLFRGVELPLLGFDCAETALEAVAVRKPEKLNFGPRCRKTLTESATRMCSACAETR